MPEPQFTIALTPGSIGIAANQQRTIELAHDFGFESVEAYPNDLAALSDEQLKELREYMDARHIVWAMAGLPVNFRSDGDAFREGMKGFPAAAQSLQRAGVTRLTTWLSPASDTLSYADNFKQTSVRLREIATIAMDNNLRFGLEYVGTKTLRDGKANEFVHTMAETKKLIAEIGQPNVGFVLDSWHWWTAGETGADILTLTNKDIVSCDLNDAPKDIAKDKQQDGSRELPLATGVIDVKPFLDALVKIGYDGPIRAEPFNAKLNDMNDEDACALVSEAMRDVLTLITQPAGRKAGLRRTLA